VSRAGIRPGTRASVVSEADSSGTFTDFRAKRGSLLTFAEQYFRMSLLSDAMRSTFTTKCCVCGAVIRRRDALGHDGLAFCSVLHEAEYIVATAD